MEKTYSGVFTDFEQKYWNKNHYSME